MASAHGWVCMLRMCKYILCSLEGKEKGFSGLSWLGVAVIVRESLSYLKVGESDRWY